MEENSNDAGQAGVYVKETLPIPEYECHEKVRALKIGVIEQSPVGTPGGVSGTWDLLPLDNKYARITVPHEYVLKHNPQPGGYFVVYKDGYQSYSPAYAFESGYTLIFPEKKRPAQSWPFPTPGSGPVKS